jgi:cytochrome c553
MKSSYRTAFGAGFVVVFCFALPAFAQSVCGTATPSASAETMPPWALPRDPEFKAPTPNDEPVQLPGSTASFSTKQARNLFFSPDWHPESHPYMPDVVSSGRRPDVLACGSCHRAEGTGGPENASLAGLPASYIVQQMADFKNGVRNVPNHFMSRIARAATDAEVEAAAAYFSALPYKSRIKVVESETIPKTFIAGVLFARDPEGGTEPLGQRIVEVPNNLKQFELRDTQSEFTVFVPVGSIAKGEALVKSGGADGKTACATCHGPDLNGLGPIPGIAGRSPTYLVRQLFDFQQGGRAGLGSALMNPQVATLSVDDMISVAAYVASLAP